MYVYTYICNMNIIIMGEAKTTRINSTIDSKLEKEFREITFKKYGYKKGSIQDGLQEAIQAWITLQKKKKT